MMKLTKEQEDTVRGWAKEGCGLSEIQKKLLAELAIPATYMEVRFLAIDMKLEIREKRSSVPVPPPAEAPAAAAGEEAAAGDDDIVPDSEPASIPGRVAVSLDRIMKPGSIVSGTVKFSDGVSAAWSLDQMGRLSMSAGTPGYSPAPQDVQAFQLELRRQLETRGF